MVEILVGSRGTGIIMGLNSTRFLKKEKAAATYNITFIVQVLQVN